MTSKLDAMKALGIAATSGPKTQAQRVTEALTSLPYLVAGLELHYSSKVSGAISNARVTAQLHDSVVTLEFRFQCVESRIQISAIIPGDMRADLAVVDLDQLENDSRAVALAIARSIRSMFDTREVVRRAWKRTDESSYVGYRNSLHNLIVQLEKPAPKAAIEQTTTIGDTDSALFEKLEKIYRKVGGPLPVKLCSSMHYQDDLGMDSLDAMEFLMEVEDTFSVEITDDDSEHMRTADDIIKFLKQRDITPR